jgi:oligopeptide transport system substrate-binding protein
MRIPSRTPVALLLVCLTLAACLPGASDTDALATQVAATIYAQQTATVPAAVEPKETAPPPTRAATSTPTSRPTSTATPPPTPTPSGPPLAKEQVLHLAIRTLKSIDPVNASARETSQIVYEMFVGLTRQDEETAEVQPAMARSWETSDDGLVWTFHLREDVPWVHVVEGEVEPVTGPDGVRTVSAYDFEYGIKRLLDPDTQTYLASLVYAIEGARAFNEGDGKESAVGVQALDAHTLEIRLAEPASHLDAIVSTHLVVAMPEWQIAAQGDEWTETRYMQSYGPYALATWTPDESLALVRNPHWPETEGVPQPTLQEITWQVMPSTAMLEAYRQGRIDMIEVYGDTLDEVMGDPALVLQPRACTYYFGFNTAQAPFDDPRVRLAFSQAVDREALIAEVLQGRHNPAQWFGHPNLRAAPAPQDAGETGVSFAPDAARALLDEAYPDRSQFPAVTFAFPDYTTDPEIAASVQQTWSDVLGVEIDLAPMQWGPYLEALNEDAPQVWRLSWCTYNYADTADMLASTFHSEGDLVKWTHWSNDVFDALLREAAAISDVDERAALYAEAEEILVRQEAAIIPVYWQNNGILTAPRIQRTYSAIGGIEHLEKWAVLAAGAPTPTPQPTRTRRPTSTPRPTPTPAPTRCLPGATFVEDVTIPDGTQFQPGAGFTKTWRLRSSGCAPWPEGVQWAFVSGEPLGAPGSVPAPATEPGQTVDISVEMVAPNAPGTYKSYWQLQTADGTPIGDDAYVMIVVPAPTPIPASCPGNPALVKVINQLSVNLTIKLQGPQISSIWVPANASRQYCAVPGTYGFTATASGFNALKGDKTLSNGACQCWWFYTGVKVNPNCSCDGDASHYTPLP